MCASSRLCDTVQVRGYARQPRTHYQLFNLCMTNYKKALGALAILGALATGGTAFAQTASTTTTAVPVDTSVTTPTAPNTGAGGSAAENYLVLGASALVAAAGALYVARGKKAAA